MHLLKLVTNEKERLCSTKETLHICYFESSGFDCDKPETFGCLMTNQNLFQKQFSVNELSSGTLLMVREDFYTVILKFDRNGLVKKQGNIQIPAKLRDCKLLLISYNHEDDAIKLQFERADFFIMNVNYGLNHKNEYEIESTIPAGSTYRIDFFVFSKKVICSTVNNVTKISVETYEPVQAETLPPEQFEVTHGKIYLCPISHRVKYCNGDNLTITEYEHQDMESNFTIVRILMVKRFYDLGCWLLVLQDANGYQLIKCLAVRGYIKGQFLFKSEDGLQDVLPLDQDRILLVYKDKFVQQWI